MTDVAAIDKPKPAPPDSPPALSPPALSLLVNMFFPPNQGGANAIAIGVGSVEAAVEVRQWLRGQMLAAGLQAPQ